MTRQTFFEHTVLERHLGDDFFEFSVLASQIFDFVTGVPYRIWNGDQRAFVPQSDGAMALDAPGIARDGRCQGGW
jgi:hypothetical protein